MLRRIRNSQSCSRRARSGTASPRRQTSGVVRVAKIPASSRRNAEDIRRRGTRQRRRVWHTPPNMIESTRHRERRVAMADWWRQRYASRSMPRAVCRYARNAVAGSRKMGTASPAAAAYRQQVSQQKLGIRATPSANTSSARRLYRILSNAAATAREEPARGRNTPRSLVLGNTARRHKTCSQKADSGDIYKKVGARALREAAAPSRRGRIRSRRRWSFRASAASGCPPKRQCQQHGTATFSAKRAAQPHC